MQGPHEWRLWASCAHNDKVENLEKEKSEKKTRGREMQKLQIVFPKEETDCKDNKI